MRTPLEGCAPQGKGRAFIVTFRPEPGTDDVLAMRALLKAALRRHGLRCVAITREAMNDPHNPDAWA